MAQACAYLAVIVWMDFGGIGEFLPRDAMLAR